MLFVFPVFGHIHFVQNFRNELVINILHVMKLPILSKSNEIHPINEKKASGWTRFVLKVCYILHT